MNLNPDGINVHHRSPPSSAEQTGAAQAQGSSQGRSDPRITNQAILDQIFATTEAGIFVIDLDFVLLGISRSLLRLIGVDGNGFVGRKCHDVLTCGRCHSPDCPQQIIMAGRQVKQLEIDLKTGDGSGRPCRMNASPLKAADNGLLGTVISIQDQSIRRQSAALHEAMLQARAASEAKGEFLAKMSHEIRTPLNGIIGMTEVAMATRLDDNQRQVLGVIEQESNHLLHIINQILDYSKIEAGKLETENISFDLRTLMDTVGGALALQADHKKLDLNVFLDPAVPRQLIGDPTRLRQVLLNITSNAIKFTSQGEIILKGELADQGPGRVGVTFSIEDTGIGIAREHQASIFNRFSQADGSITRKYGGTGLGMTISHHLVQLLGGQIELESKVGQGTSIRFTLPFQMPAHAAPPPLKDHIAWQNIKVLMVDDCFSSRQFALKYLGIMGCTAAEAEDGPPALAMLDKAASQKAAFDLIITDFRMPRMSGYELAREIRQMDAYRQTPIIAVTGLQEVSTGKDLRSLGFDCCLAKPLKMDELQKAMTEVLSSDSTPCRHAAESCADLAASFPTRKGRILLVEDYLANQQVVNMHLSSVGFQVDTADDGETCIRLFRQNHYDLILMDLEMPIMDGYAAAEEIRRMERRHPEETSASIPIIALTAHALKGIKEKCLAAGMNDCLIKPVWRNQLLQTVGRWLAQERSLTSSEKPVSVPGGSEAVSDDCPMDMKRALDEFMGQKTVLENVLDGFLKKVHHQLDIIDEALAANDAETVRKEAHAVKGGAANLTARPLSAAALALEMVGKSGALGNGRKILADVQRELKRLEAHIASTVNLSS